MTERVLRVLDRLRYPRAIIVSLIVMCLGLIGVIAPSLAESTGAPPTKSAIGGAPDAASPVASPVPSGAPLASATSLPPAPSGFSQQIVNLYKSIYAAAQASGALRDIGPSDIKLTTPTQYAALVDRITSQELSAYYAMTQKESGWSKLPATFNRLAATLSKAQVSSKVAKQIAQGDVPSSPTSVDNSIQAHVEVPFPPALSSGSFPQPQTVTPNPSVQPANVPQTCPNPAPGSEFGATALFAAQTAIDILQEVADGLSPELGFIIAAVPALIPDPITIVAQAAALAGQLILDSLNYLENNANNDCGYVQTDGYAANIDNTTINIYNLLSMQMQSTLDSVQGGLDTIGNQLSTVQQTIDDELAQAIESALSEPLPTSTDETAPPLAFELPSSVGGNLDSTPIGVQELVTSVVAAIPAAGEAENAQATRELQLANAALASSSYLTAYADYHQAYLYAVQ